MCDDLSFINTTQKTSKPSKKMFQLPGWMRKTSYPGISAEGYRQKHEMQVASKKIYWKKNRVFQTLATYCHWKDIFSELNRCIFQISLKYIKLVIPKILFMLVLCSFNFYFKIMWPLPLTKLPPPNNITPPPKKKFLSLPPPSPQKKPFWNFSLPPPGWKGVHALCFLNLQLVKKLDLFSLKSWFLCNDKYYNHKNCEFLLIFLPPNWMEIKL